MMPIQTACLILLLAQLAGPASGQEASSSALQSILDALQANRDSYRSNLPAFFCSEHVVSRMDYGRHLEHKQVSVTDSVFHLKRVLSPDQEPDLIEARSEMTINGSPSPRVELGGPVVLSNVFSRGLDYVSLRQKGCASYSLKTPLANQSKDLQRVTFETVQSHAGVQGCVFAEAASGTVTFDRRVQQVTRIDATMPHHLIARPDDFGRWDLSVEYGPVLMGEHTYWLPNRITSTLVPLDGEDVLWRFTATYSGFHKYAVESHIVPSTGSEH